MPLLIVVLLELAGLGAVLSIDATAERADAQASMGVPQSAPVSRDCLPMSMISVPVRLCQGR